MNIQSVTAKTLPEFGTGQSRFLFQLMREVDHIKLNPEDYRVGDVQVYAKNVEKLSRLADTQGAYVACHTLSMISGELATVAAVMGD